MGRWLESSGLGGVEEGMETWAGCLRFARFIQVQEFGFIKVQNIGLSGAVWKEYEMWGLSLRACH